MICPGPSEICPASLLSLFKHTRKEMIFFVRKANAQDCKGNTKASSAAVHYKQLLAVGPEKQYAVGTEKSYGEPKTTKRYHEKTISAP